MHILGIVGDFEVDASRGFRCGLTVVELSKAIGFLRARWSCKVLLRHVALRLGCGRLAGICIARARFA
jgi:hypothetical protein